MHHVVLFPLTANFDLHCPCHLGSGKGGLGGLTLLVASCYGNQALENLTGCPVLFMQIYINSFKFACKFYAK